MADNVEIGPGGGGATNVVDVSTDEAASGHVQRVKLTQSADGSDTHVQADADGLLVNLGTNNDVTVTGTVTADTELPAAAALTDNFANPTAPGVGAFVMGWDGATWDRMPGNSTDGQLVNLGANNDVTVTGSVSVTGSVDTELPAAAALTDNFANPTAPGVGAFVMGWDGATWDRMPGNSTDGQLVNLGANNDVTVTGSVSVTGSVDTELPAAAALADNTSNPTVPGVGGFGMVWDGATWDRQPGTSVDGTLVNLGTNNDVTVTSGSITADTELPAAAALADNTANPTVPGVGAFLMGWDGANWDRVPNTSVDGMLVNLGANNDVTVTGTVTTSDTSTLVDNAGFTDGVTRVGMSGYIFDETAGTSLTENDAAAARIDSKRAQIGVIEDETTRGRRLTITAANAAKVDGSGVTQPVSGTVTANQGTAGTAWEVIGDVANDQPAATNPVTVGFRASANEPTAVSTDGDAVHAWADLLGRLVVLTGHPNPEAPVTVNLVADGQVIATPGASLSLYICKGSVHNRGTTNNTVALEDGSGGTERWKAELAAEGGGSLFDFGSRGWKLTANTALFADLGAAGDVDINITEYYIAP